jgi:hypothetical protein
MDDNNLPDFDGKLVVLYVSNPARAIQDGIVLEYASFVDYGGKVFVSGRVPEIDDAGLQWVSNLKAGVSWETVNHYLIFNSREDYMARVGNVKPSLLHRIFGLSQTG